jgi:hypothetical protein
MPVRQHPELDREHQLEQQPGEEDRGGIAEDREDPQHRVADPVAEVGREHAERDAHDERHDQRVHGQLQGGRAIGDEHLGDRTVVAQRRAEVAAQQPAEVVAVLHQQRPVVAGRVDPLGQLLRGEPSALGGRDGVAGAPHQQEHQRDQDEDGRDDQQEADHQVGPEAATPAGLARGGDGRDACVSVEDGHASTEVSSSTEPRSGT